MTISTYAIPKNPAEPVTDLSPRVVRLARFLDRLPQGGQYIIRLVKPDTRWQHWQVEISRSETLREMEY